MSSDAAVGDGEHMVGEMMQRFELLQRKLVPMWQWIGRTDPGGPNQVENTIVVVPSLTEDMELNIAAQQAYEERMLFMLFLLQQPGIRLIFVTSLTIQPEIIDYYLDILPGTIISSARRRLSLVSPQDTSSRPLTQKILERPRLIERIRQLIPDLDRAHLVPFNTTDLERQLAVRLDVPMYAADPRFFAFGTKSGCRRIFAEEGVQYPLGAENLYSEADILRAIVQMRREKPGIERVIVKLNRGVAGMGNAVVELAGLPDVEEPGVTESLAERLRNMRFELEEIKYDGYMDRLGQQGCVVEEMVDGREIHSPSAQLRVTPLGEVEQLSTHDQLLGGPSGQSYLGARFPANPEYGPLIMREAAKIGRRFANEGIVGRFAVDFVVVRQASGAWQPYAIEVNLRKGGTTHPFLTLQYLTDGKYDPDAGVFKTVRGDQKCYVASDHVESPNYRAFTVVDLFDVVGLHGLHFNHTIQSGVVMHFLSGVGGLGRLGATSIADTFAEADALHQRFVNALDEEAEKALDVFQS